MAHPPNILFLLPDQHRPDWLGCNPGLPLRTPNLDQLCSSGVRFVNAFSPSPLCAPARACLASGMDYENCRVPSNREHYPADLPTYYQRLRDAGYRVAGVGKFDLHKDLALPVGELDWGLDGSRSLAEWGFTEGIDNGGKLDGSNSYRSSGRPRGPYMDYLARQGLADDYEREHRQAGEHRDAYITALPDEAYCDNWLSENGLEFLREFPKDQPWHLVVNFTGPHNPMDVTARMAAAWEGVEFPMPIDDHGGDYSAEDHQRNRRHYAAAIENIDRQVGRFIDAVRERGELDNTLIVYSSDHGEMLGDHGCWGKCTWYQPSVGIPLIVAGPGVRQGVVSDALVCLHDLAATFLDYAAAPALPGMDARSLREVLAGRTDQHREVARSALGDWKMEFDGRHKRILRQGRTALYDLAEDPLELRDVAAAHAELYQEERA